MNVYYYLENSPREEVKRKFEKLPGWVTCGIIVVCKLSSTTCTCNIPCAVTTMDSPISKSLSSPL